MKHLPLLTLLLSSLVHAAAPGDLQEGKWVVISQASGVGSTILSVSGEAYGDLDGIMAWSGGSFATNLGTRGSLLVWGGGHSDHFGNEVYAFDVALGTWSRLTDHSTGGCNLVTSQHPDGRPCTNHTYDNNTFSPLTGEMFKLGSSSDWDQGGAGTGFIDAFNPVTRTWRRGGRLATFTDGAISSGEAAHSTWDSHNNVLWWLSGNRYHNAAGNSTNNLQKIDPTTATTIGSYTGIFSNGDGALAFSPELKSLVFLENKPFVPVPLRVWDVTTGTPVRYNPSVTNAPAEGYIGRCGFDWDPIAQKGAAYCGDTDLKVLTPSATWAASKTGSWVWTTPAVGSGSAVPSDGVGTVGQYGRFAYVPALCGFIYSSGIGNPVYAYRLVGGAGTGCGGTPPVDPLPGLVMTVAPASINNGQSSTITWSTSNVSSCTASGGWSGAVATSGNQVVAPVTTTDYTLTCLGTASQIATPVTLTRTVTVQQATGSTDFDTRCAATGVVRCTSFDTAEDFTLGVEVFANGQGVAPTRDTATKSSGAASMRFSLPAVANANVAGYWLQTLWDETYVHPVDGLVGGVDTDHFGPGETFYMQYRQRMDSNFHNTPWRALTANNGYPKQWIMHTTFNSCTSLEFSAVERYDTNIPFIYGQCGNVSLWQTLPPGDNWLIQQGPTLDCRYQGLSSSSNCKRYAADNWMTFYYRFTLGAFGDSTTIVQGWMGLEGEGPTQYVNIPDFVLEFAVNSNEKLQMLQLTPYMTGRSTSDLGLPAANTWYDDLIVSTQPIAWPVGGSANPVPTVTLSANPISIASGAATTLTWSTSNATSCEATGGWTGTRGTAGSESTGNLTASQTYTLTCTGSGGTTPAQTSVTVAAAPPTVTISANPANVLANAATLLTWSTTGALTCTGTGGWSGAKATAGTFTTGALATTTTFGLDCTGTGEPASGSTTVTVTSPFPVITVLTCNGSNPATVDYGTRCAIIWNTTYAQSCSWASGFPAGTNAVVPGAGRLSLDLTTQTVFTLSCANAAGIKERSVTVSVNPIPNPTVTLTADPATIASGSSTLTWVTTNAASCAASGGWGPGAKTAGGGSEAVSPVITTSYTLTCTAANGATAVSSATVTVNSDIPAPVVVLIPLATQIQTGTATTLYWDSTDAAAVCTATGDWSGVKAIAGNESTGNLTANKSYTLTCVGTGGTDSASTQVTVQAAPVNPAATITANPAQISAGETTRLNWSCTNSTSATPSLGTGEWAGSYTGLTGSRETEVLGVDTTFTINCTDGVTPDSESVTVDVLSDPLSMTLVASPSTVSAGGSSTLTWTTGGILDICLATGGWSGYQVADGSLLVGPLSTATTFILSCGSSLNPFGEFLSQSVTVTVQAAVAPSTSRRRWRPWWRR